MNCEKSDENKVRRRKIEEDRKKKNETEISAHRVHRNTQSSVPVSRFRFGLFLCIERPTLKAFRKSELEI
jgi:hypothetical protein